MIAGFHTTALNEHEWSTAASLLGRIGYSAIGVRLSRARLNPFAESSCRERQIELLSRAGGNLQWIIDADGRFLIDPWSPGTGNLMQEGPERERRLECLRGAIAIAARIGGRMVTFATGGAPPAMETQRGMDRLAEAILQLAPLAEAAGVTLALRPRLEHFVDSIGRFERLTEWLEGHADLRLAADVGTMVAGGEMPVVDLLVRSRRLACVYLSDVRWVPGDASTADALIGGSQVAADRVVRGLAEHRFAGPMMVEPALADRVDPGLAAAFYEKIFGRAAGGPPTLATFP